MKTSRAVAGTSVGRIVAAAVSAAWFVVITRAATPTTVGHVTTALAVYAVVGVAADLGIPLQLIARVADGDDAWIAFTEASRRRTRLALVATLGLVVAVSALIGSVDVVLCAGLGLSLVATGLHHNATAALKSLGRPFVDPVNEVVSRVGLLAVGALLAGLVDLTAGQVGLVYGLADLASAVVCVWLLRRAAASSADGDRPAPRAITIRSAPTFALSAAMVLSAAHSRADLWILSALSTAPRVAAYGIAYRVFEALVIPGGALGPLLVARSGTRRKGSGMVSAIAATAVVATGAGVVALAAHPVVVHLFGASYADAIPVLRVLCLVTVPATFATVGFPTAAVRNPQRAFAAIAAALATNVVLNLVFVPVHGPIAAAWAAMASSTLLAVAVWTGSEAVVTPPSPVAV